MLIVEKRRDLDIAVYDTRGQALCATAMSAG